MKTEFPLWQSPSANDLNDSLKTILQSYSVHSTTRRKQVNLLENVMELPDEIKIGALIFIGESIANSYVLRSPENSTLYTMIQKTLHIDLNNTMDPLSRFLFLSALLEHLQDVDLEHTYYSDVLSITKHAKTAIQSIIDDLVKGLPTHASLIKNFSQIEEKYNHARSHLTGTEYLFSFFMNTQSSKRIQAIQFLKSLDQRLAEQNEDEDYLIRLGALLNLMHKFEKEYKFTSPENSFLYKQLQEITNLKSTSDLAESFKKIPISQLDALLCRDQWDEDTVKFWESNEIELEQIENELTEYRVEIMKYQEKDFFNSPTLNNLIGGFLETTLKAATRVGMVYACFQIAQLLAYSNISFTTLLAMATPQHAAILMASIWLITRLRDELSSLAIRSTQNILSYVITMPLKFLLNQNSINDSLEMQIHETDLDLIDRRLLLALYRSPNEIFSLPEKRQLENVFQIETLREVDEEKSMKMVHC